MAGNHRAAASAHMAAEYGASELMSYDQTLLSASKSAFEAFLESEGYDEYASNPVGDSSYFRVGAAGASNISFSAWVEGATISGEVVDEDVISLRVIDFMAVLEGLGDLSPINYASPLACYDGATSAASEVEGDEEEVDGFRYPAISAASPADAKDIVDSILGNDPNAGEKFVFVPSDPNANVDFDSNGVPSVDGIFHAVEAVVYDDDNKPYYTGNYAACDDSNNRMCNYKGGIATWQGANILGEPAAFHNFMRQIFEDSGAASGDDTYVTDTTNQTFSGFNMVTYLESDEDKNSNIIDGEYLPARTVELDGDGNEIIVPPERDFFPKGNSFSGSGFLVINGDVEFKGNPDFEGVVVVLGDYILDGGGGDDFKGAIISAPYSCDASGENCDFEPICIDVSGGGNNDYIHVAQAIHDAFEILAGVSGDAFDLWVTGNTGEDTYSYELVGWRERVRDLN